MCAFESAAAASHVPTGRDRNYYSASAVDSERRVCITFHRRRRRFLWVYIFFFFFLSDVVFKLDSNGKFSFFFDLANSVFYDGSSKERKINKRL